MRELKFKYVFSDGKSFRSTVLTLENIEDGALKSYVNAIPSSFKLIATCQFTGVEDKNRVEIYEGDIQKLTFGKHYWIYVVKSIGGQLGNTLFSVTIKDNLSTDEDEKRYTYIERLLDQECRNYVKSGGRVEVIGNIYENKELL